MLKVPYNSKSSKHIYLDKDVLTREVQSCIDNGRQVSDELAKHFCSICDHLLEAKNFRSYSTEWKDKMRDFAMTKLCKSIKTVDLTKCKNVFNYFSRAAYLAFVTSIQRQKKMSVPTTQLSEYTLE